MEIVQINVINVSTTRFVALINYLRTGIACLSRYGVEYNYYKTVLELDIFVIRVQHHEFINLTKL